MVGVSRPFKMLCPKVELLNVSFRRIGTYEAFEWNYTSVAK